MNQIFFFFGCAVVGGVLLIIGQVQASQERHRAAWASWWAACYLGLVACFGYIEVAASAPNPPNLADNPIGAGFIPVYLIGSLIVAGLAAWGLWGIHELYRLPPD